MSLFGHSKVNIQRVVTYGIMRARVWLWAQASVIHNIYDFDTSFHQQKTFQENKPLEISLFGITNNLIQPIDRAISFDYLPLGIN